MRTILIAACLSISAAAAAQDRPVPAPAVMSIETIFSPEARVKGPGLIRWTADGHGYVSLEPSGTEAEGLDIVRRTAASGDRTVLMSSQDLVALHGGVPLAMEDIELSPDSSVALIKANSSPGVAGSRPLSEFWLLDLRQRTLHRIGRSGQAAMLVFADLSPDGRSIAYVLGSDLYVEAADGLSPPRRLTRDGSDVVLNGAADWVYEEELGLSKAFQWSPDSRRIAFWRFDTSPVGVFRMIKNTARPYPQVIDIRIPKVGTANSAVRVGVVDAVSEKTTWLAIPQDQANTYIPQMTWASGSESLLVQSANREQNAYQVWTAEPATGRVQRLFEEDDKAWVERNAAPVWLAGDKGFVWLSERDGWRHLYTVSRDGQDFALRTPGDYDVISLLGVDARSHWAYIIASPREPTKRFLYRVALSGKPRVERVTARDRGGWNQYDLAPGGQWAIEASSSRDTPPVIRLISLLDGHAARTLQENLPLARFVAANPVPPTEFMQLDIGAGVKLDAWLMKPVGFDPAKRYPVLVQVYGEPAGVTVTDQWPGARGLWHRALAQRGYIVASIDPRGTPQPRGRAWRKSIYRQVGILASADFAAGVQRLLADRPYIDPARVGVWGWSGGGAMTLNAMFRYPEIFKTGIAVSSPSDQLLYDTIYQERYMGLPQDNPKGYHDGSPINFVQNLKGNLLLIHGTGDDNVHYQHSEQLVERLIAANKQFSMMAYPDRAHFLSEMYVGNPTSVHMFTLMTNFLDAHLMGSGVGAGSVDDTAADASAGHSAH